MHIDCVLYGRCIADCPAFPLQIDFTPLQCVLFLFICVCTFLYVSMYLCACVRKQFHAGLSYTNSCFFLEPPTIAENLQTSPDPAIENHIATTPNPQMLPSPNDSEWIELMQNYSRK